VAGRQAELTALEEAIDAATKGRGACLLFVGEAGSGKTRLLREAAVMAQRRAMVTLSGSPPRVVAPAAFGVLAEALRAWTRIHPPTPDLEPFAAGLRQILPEWPAPREPGGRLSADQLRLLALEGAFRLLVAAAERAGGLLLLDDLQEADPETVQFLHHASAAAAENPFVLIGAIRSPEGREAEGEARAMQARGHATVFPLGPLEQPQVAEVVEAILGVPPPPDLVDDVMGRTDGVPLLVEETIEAHLAAGALRVEWGSARWSGERSAGVPATTIGIVRDKVGRLSDPSRAVLTAGAILGGFEPDVVGDVAGVERDALAGALREGAEVGLLEERTGEMAFRHALVREALVASLTPPEREHLHRSSAEALANIHGDDPAFLEQRAHHLDLIGDREGASRLLIEAGRRSLDVQTPASAEATLRRALALAAESETVARARDELAEAVGMVGRWEEALALDAETTASSGETAERLERMARNAVSAGRLDEADEIIEQAGRAGVPAARLDALAGLIALWQGRLEEAVASAERVLETDGEPVVVCQALDVLGRANDALGRRGEAESAFVRWIEDARRAGLTASELQALMELGTLEFLAGGPADRLEEARELASRAGVFATLVLADLSLLWWTGRRAQVERAVTLGQEAVDLCRRFSLDLLPHALMATGWARNLGRCGDGESLVAEALAAAPDDVDLVILAAWIRGESELRAGRAEVAVEHLELAAREMAAAPSAVPPPAPFLWPCALMAAGRAEEAATVVAEVQTSPARPRQYVNGLWLAVAEALVKGSEPDLDHALASMRDSAPFDHAVARVLSAEVLGGDRSEQLLREALATFEVGGLETDAARARSMLRSIGAPVPRARRTAAGLPRSIEERGVTAREAEVLALVTEGMTNAEIARRLFLSPRTVQAHVSSLLAKLGVPTRAGLIAIGAKMVETVQPDSVASAD
jgi:DNA-binding NarL/FixJ family response regulator